MLRLRINVDECLRWNGKKKKEIGICLHGGVKKMQFGREIEHSSIPRRKKIIEQRILSGLSM